MSALIPQKLWRLHSDLHKSMKQTHRTEESFKKFKSLVRHHACILDKTKMKDEQAMEAWDAFLAQILAVQPELAMYQDFWPIRSYWESYIRKHKARMKSQSVTKEREELHEIAVVEQTSFQIPRSITVSMESGQRVCPTSSRHAVARISNSQSGDIQTRRYNATPSIPPIPRFYKRTPSSSGFAFASSSHNPICCDENENEEESQAVISCCPLCDPPDLVDPLMNRELRDCLSHNDSLLSSLADVGILFDQHLHLLCKLTQDDWESFLESIPASNMSVVEKSEVLNALSQAAAHGVNVACIPSPSALVELDIINPALEGSQAFLQNAMGLQDKEHVFQDLWSVMKLESFSFLQKSNPDIQDLVNAICNIINERPQFEHYDNFWPIRLYLLRMQSLANVRPTYQTDEEQLQFIEAFIRHVENRSEKTVSRPTTTTVIQIPCRRHNPVDLSLVQASVRTDLHARGLGELIPAMPYLGIFNDDELAAFTVYSDAEKDESINLSGVKLTRFQTFILKNSFV